MVTNNLRTIKALATRLNPSIDLVLLEQFLSETKFSDIELSLIIKVLEAEESLSFFDNNHFYSTLEFKKHFNYEVSNKCTQLFSIIYPSLLYGGSSLLNVDPLNTNVLNQISEKINNDGYWVSDQLLDNDYVDRIVKRLSQYQFYMRNKIGRIKGYDKTKAENIKSNTAWIEDQSELMQIREISKIVNDPYILNIISSTFKCIPIHVQTNVWWSLNYNNSKQSKNANAQLFHQDKEFIKFLKVFIYLNDVTEENGAHVYVKQSHKYNSYSADPQYHFSKRIMDNEIEESFGKENIITMNGKKGSIIIEDTSGFHKGMPVKKGHRLLLQIEYAISLFFNPGPAFATNNLDNAFKEFLSKNERFGLNYDQNKYYKDNKAIKRKRLIKNSKGYIKEAISKLIK